MEGELQKRIKQMSWQDEEYADVHLVGVERIKEIIDEARKTFPNSFLIRTEPYGKIESDEKFYSSKEIDEWFVKWFGSSK